MLYYPQLTTGNVSQFPVTRKAKMRTVANQLAGGFTIRMSDTGFQKLQWRLGYSSLTDSERTAIEDLFEASEGQLNTFTFLDPTANLLAWSEDWTQNVWTADPMLQVLGGLPDPLGGTGAMQITNAGQAAQQIVQNIGGPSPYTYCFSVFLRSNVPITVQLVMSAAGQTSYTAVTTGCGWAQATVSACAALQGVGLAFGVQIPAGSQIEAFGAQVEAQPQAGVYKKTTNLGGIFPNTRFSSDSLIFTTTAPNQNACDIQLISSLM